MGNPGQEMMTDQKQRVIPRFQFRLRTLFLGTAIIALVLGPGRVLYDRYFAVPLAEEVRVFNLRARNDSVGRLEPRITEDEVIASINSQLQSITSNRVRAIYSRIARTRRLPKGAMLDSISGYTNRDGESFRVWWINLGERQVRIYPNSYCRSYAEIVKGGFMIW